MDLYMEQSEREGNGHTSRYLRFAVETSSLVSLGKKRPSLLTISPQQINPGADPILRGRETKRVSTARPISISW